MNKPIGKIEKECEKCSKKGLNNLLKKNIPKGQFEKRVLCNKCLKDEDA